MSGPNMLKHEKFHSIGIHTNTPTLEEIKENVLNRLLSYEPVLARAKDWYSHLIEYDPQSDPPKLRWKIDILKQSSIDYIMGVTTYIDKVKEEQTKIC
jgi:hypothetical protein